MINEPYNGKLGGNHSQNNSIGFEIDPDRQGILFEFRNDLLTDPVRGAKLEKDVKEILEKLIATEPTKQPPLKPKELKPTGPVVKFKESINYIAVSYNKEPKVRLCFIAEHAGHSLPGSLGWSESDEKNIVSRNLHYARNTFELADYLAQQFETSFIATKLSKLVVDPNKQLTSPTIFPKVIYGVPVELNSLMTYEQESERYERYFLDLMSGVIYLHNIISSHFWFSIQSFPDFHLPQTDLILSFYTNEKFAEKMKKSFEKKGYSVLMNHKDFDGNQLFGYTNTTFLNGMYPRKRESLIFVFSSKLLDHHLDKLKEDFSELIRFRCIKDE